MFVIEKNIQEAERKYNLKSSLPREYFNIILAIFALGVLNGVFS